MCLPAMSASQNFKLTQSLSGLPCSVHRSFVSAGLCRHHLFGSTFQSLPFQQLLLQPASLVSPHSLSKEPTVLSTAPPRVQVSSY